MNMNVDKAALRHMLDAAVQRKLEHEPEAITLNAPKPAVTHKPWQPKPSLQHKAFQEELAESKAKVETPHSPISTSASTKMAPGMLRIEGKPYSPASRSKTVRKALCSGPAKSSRPV